jgi:hypothetical protein
MGTVVAKSNGQPIAGIIVGALYMDSASIFLSQGFNPQFAVTPYCDTTKADGSYTIKNMPLGAYIVFARGQNYLSQFYLNADSVAGAKRISVDSVNIPSINFSLSAGGSISGRVVTKQGKPLAQINVNVNAFLGSASSWTMTDSLGKFMVGGLPAGRYCISPSGAAVVMVQDSNQCNYSLAAGAVLSGITLVADVGGIVRGPYTAPASQDSLYGQGFEIAYFRDTLASKDNTIYESGSAWANVFGNNPGITTGAYFISNPIPPGTWKLVLRPQQGNNVVMATTQPYVASRAYSFLGASGFSAQTPITITGGDTTVLSGANFGKGYSVFGRLLLEGGEKGLWCTITAFVKDSAMLIPISRTSVISDSVFGLAGLIDGQDYFIRVDAPNYPSQFWSPSGSAIKAVSPYHFSTVVFSAPSPYVVRIPQGMVTAPPTLYAWYSVSDTGGFLIQCGAPTSLSGIQRLLLHGKDMYGNITTLTTWAYSTLGGQYSWKETRDVKGSYSYVVVAEGAASGLRSNIVYYSPDYSRAISADSLLITLTPARAGVQINWQSDSSRPITDLDTTVLYRKKANDTGWTTYQKAWGAQKGFFDGSWDKAKDLNAVALYRLKMITGSQVVKQSAIVSFTATKAFIDQMANQLSVGPTMKYATIQQAIDAAQSFDIINVQPGLYRENIDFKGKVVSLQGAWGSGVAPIIDGIGGVAITVPYTSKSMDMNCITIGGFKFQNCLSAIMSMANISINQCLFTAITAQALQCITDSSAVALAGQTDPFAQFQINQNVWQCTFIGKGSGVALSVFSKTGPAIVDSVNGMNASAMTLGGHIGASNSIFAFYGSQSIPALGSGARFTVDLQNCDFWQTSLAPPSSQVNVGASPITVDPVFIDTVNYFLSDNSRLKTLAVANGTYGYDGRRFYNQATNQPVIPAVTGFKAAIAGPRKISLSWNALPDSVKIKGYVVFRIFGYDSLFTVDGSQWKLKVPDSLVFSYVDTFHTSGIGFIDSTLIIGKPYIYAAAGVSADGYIGNVDFPFPPPLSSYIITIDPPSCVPALTGVPVGFTAVALQWKKPIVTKTTPVYSLCRIAGGNELYRISSDSAAIRALVRQKVKTHSGAASFSTGDTVYFDATVKMDSTYLYVVSVFDSVNAFEQRPLTWTLAKIDTSVYREQRTMKLFAGQWNMVGPWGVGAVAFTDTANVAYRWNDAKAPDKLYSQYVAANSLQSGCGYWVNSGSDMSITISDSMFGMVIKQRDSIGISLAKGLTGWSQISSPFPFAIAPAWLDGTVYTAYAWNADSSQYMEQMQLEPWRACWVHIERDTQLVFRASDVVRTASIRPTGKRLRQAAWELKVSLCGASNDPDNYLGVVAQTTLGGVRLLSPKPPQAFDYPQLYFINAGASGEKLSKLYKTSAATPDKKLEWMVGVSPSAKPMKIKVLGVASAPEKDYLFWVTANSVVNLREKSDIDVPAHAKPAYGYIVATTNPRDLALYTNRVELRRGYPNPFRKSTTIEFVVPYAWNADGSKKEGETRELSLSAFNLAGRRLATLVSGKVDVGEHKILWNGRDGGGGQLSPGILIIRLSGNDFQRTIKVFKVR